MLADDAMLIARQVLKIRTGVGMRPPFYAETSHVNGDQDWPDWIVRNATCNSLGGFGSREECEALAAAMNEVANG